MGNRPSLSGELMENLMRNSEKKVMLIEAKKNLKRSNGMENM